MARELKVAPVLASEWTVESDDDAPDEWKTLIEKTFFPLRDEFLASALYYGDVDFGYQCFEKVIEPKDGYLKLVRLKPLLHDITEICIGHQGGFIGVRQLGKDLGLANSVHVGFRIEGSYLYGIPLLENARQAYNWWVDCNEGARRYDRKIAGAHIVVEYPLGSSIDRNGHEVENAVLARTVLDNLEAAGGVAVPRDMAAFMQQLNLESPGWKIWILDAGASQQASFIGRLEYLDKQLCRCLHIPERAMMEGQHGTLAEAEAHSDVIFTIQDIEHRRVTDELNRQAVDQMLSLNFGKEAVGKVRLKACPIVDEKKSFFKQIYQQILASPAGQKELQSLDAASLREQLGLPQVQNDPGDVEHEGANLQAIPGLSAGQPGGEGKGLMAQGPDGQPVTVPGSADNPAAAMANAVWGMREAVALSSTALRKAEEWAKGEYPAKAGPLAMAGNEGEEEQDGKPLELAGTEPVEQEPWQEDPNFKSGVLGYKTKSVPLGDKDYLNFESLTNREGEDPDIEDVRSANNLDYPHEVLMSRAQGRAGGANGRFGITGQGKAGQIISHSAQALRGLINRYKPVSVEFSAAEPSRMKAYRHLMRRLAEEGVGNGKYAFLHEPGYEYLSHEGEPVWKSEYYHIVHHAAVDLPKYWDMEPIGQKEMVGMAGTMSDVLASRPITGRLSENMNSVAMENETPEESVEKSAFSRQPPHTLLTPTMIGKVQEMLDAGTHPLEIVRRTGIKLNTLQHANYQGKLRGLNTTTSNPTTESISSSAPYSLGDEQREDRVPPKSRRRTAPLLTPEIAELVKRRQKEGKHIHEISSEININPCTIASWATRGLIPAFPKLGMGVKTTMTPELAKKISGMLDEGHGVSAVERALGIRDRVLYGHIAKGRIPGYGPKGLSNNPPDAQRKSISEAIDAPEYSRPTSVSPGMQILLALRARRRGEDGGYANMSPGQKILFELRARRGARFANDPAEAGFSPKMQQPASTPVAEYLGHGPTDEGKYGISYRTPEGEQQHLSVAKIQPIENEHAGDRMMQATFHNGTVVNMRMPEEHRKQIFSQLLAQAKGENPIPLTREQEIARKAEQKQADRVVEIPRHQVKPTKKIDTGGMHLEMPAVPYVGNGERRRVASSAPDAMSEHFRNDIVPQLISRFADQPEQHAGIQKAGDFGVGKTIASTWHQVAARRKDTEQVKPQNIHNAVPLVYQAVLNELPDWKPSEVSLPQFVMRITSKYFNRLTREPIPTEIPDTDTRKATDSKGNPTRSLDPSERGEASMLGESNVAEEDYKHKLAGLWMGPHLDKAGMEVFQQQKSDPTLKQLRSKYGDEVVNDRISHISQLMPYFTAWMEGDYNLPEEAYQFMPKPSEVKAKNILPISKVAYNSELTFLNRFTKGLSPEEKAAAKLLYYSRRQGSGTAGIVQHEELPEAFRSKKKLEQISARMTAAAKQFDQENGTGISKKIGKQFKPTRERSVYVEEPEHHAGVEEYIRDMLSQENAQPPLLKILTQSLLGKVPLTRLESDPELIDLAKQRYKDLRAVGKGSKAPEGAHKLVHNYSKKFKNWVPEYFETIDEPELAQKYRDKNAERSASGVQSSKVKRGEAAPQSLEEIQDVKNDANKLWLARKRKERDQNREAIDRSTLKLDAVQKAFHEAFGEGSTRTDKWRFPEVPRDKFGMMLLMSKLEHEPMNKFLQRPEVQVIVNQPGFFRDPRVTPTPRSMENALKRWWQHKAMPVIMKASPVLHTLMGLPHNDFRSNYHPLSRSVESVESE